MIVVVVVAGRKYAVLEVVQTVLEVVQTGRKVSERQPCRGRRGSSPGVRPRPDAARQENERRDDRIKEQENACV